LQLNITKNFNLKNIKLDFSRPLNIAIDYIAKDIEKGIEAGQQDGRAFQDNAPATVKKKGFNKPLVETGEMKDSSQFIKVKATTQNQRAILRPNANNIKKVDWNHNGTQTIPARKFWLISKDAEKKALDFASQYLQKEIRDA